MRWRSALVFAGLSCALPARARAEDEAPIEVVVTGERGRDEVRDRDEARTLPGAFDDPFRAIEASPGVTPIASGLPYFYVRGAPPGNVGYFLDDVMIPTLFHAGAGPSVVHPSFVERLTLYKGGYPARYGRVAGAVVAAETGPPSRRPRGEAMLRVFDAAAAVETPLSAGDADVALAGRYAYTGPVLGLFAPELSVDYWDYQLRGTYRVGERGRLRLLAFGSHDFAAETQASGSEDVLYKSTFHRADLRYDRALGAGETVTLAATLGWDSTSGDSDAFSAEGAPRAARLRYVRALGGSTMLRAGLDALHDSIRVTGAPEGVIGFDTLFPSRDDWGLGAHVELELFVSSDVSVRPGLRADLYRSGDDGYVSVEPRLGASFRLSSGVFVEHELGLARQAPSFVFPVPGLRPGFARGLQTSVQSSSGLRIALPEQLALRATVFQNLFFNLTDDLGASRLDLESGSVYGTRSRGRAVGLELQLSRPFSERVGGFVAYTLSRSERTYEGVRGPASFDRPHVLSAAVGYDMGRGFRGGLRGVAFSGTPVLVAYADVASSPPRGPGFVRLDVRFEKRWALDEQGAFLAVVAEVQNATLSEEVLRRSCNAFTCKDERIGPVTLPSLGLEAGF
jgi:hypothetical protein